MWVDGMGIIIMWGGIIHGVGLGVVSFKDCYRSRGGGGNHIWEGVGVGDH